MLPDWLSAEGGFTLIELLVAMVLSIIVIGSAITFLVVSFHQQNDISSRTVAVNQAEQGLEQLVVDLREADGSLAISAATDPTISFDIPTPGTAGAQSELVTWCYVAANSTVGTYYRLVGSGTCGASSKSELSGVTNLTLTAENDADPPAALAVPVASGTNVSAVQLSLSAQDSSYGLYPRNPSATAAVGGSTPIVLNTTADLQNYP